MGLLEFHWGHHPKRAVQAPVVVPVDPAGGGVLDVADGSEGEMIARLEADVLLSELARSVARFELAGDPVWQPSNTLRGLVARPVTLIADSGA